MVKRNPYADHQGRSGMMESHDPTPDDYRKQNGTRTTYEPVDEGSTTRKVDPEEAVKRTHRERK